MGKSGANLKVAGGDAAGNGGCRPPCGSKRGSESESERGKGPGAKPDEARSVAIAKAWFKGDCIDAKILTTSNLRKSLNLEP
jgi:hypothetical protein